MTDKNLFAFSRPITKFIDMEFTFPVNVYAKDLNSRFLAVNTHQLQYAKTLLQTNTESICGVSMEELFHGFPNICKQIVSNDKKALKKHSYFFIEEGAIKDTTFSIKTTVRDSTNKIVGIFGFSFYLNHVSIGNIMNAINELQLFANVFDTPGSFIISSNNEILSLLSPREKECVAYLVRGMSCKEIGAAMTISNRTVECHIDHIKNKLSCNTKSQLMTKVFDYVPNSGGNSQPI